MDIFISIVVFLFVFSLLILVHEWGHFIAARKSGVKVEEFGLGLPPQALRLKKDKKGTVYSLNWIPFGGFVRMLGEDSTDGSLRDREGSFSSKSLHLRTIIILGGVAMNFLLGFVLLLYLFSVGTKPFIVTADDFEYYREQGIVTTQDQVQIVDIPGDSPAVDGGLVSGDILLSANGVSLFTNADLVSQAQESKGSNIVLELRRGEELMTLSVPVNEEGRLGVVISDAPVVLNIEEISYPFPEVIVRSAQETGRLSYLTMKMFVEVLFDFFTKAELSEQVSGPVGIAQLTYTTTQNGGLHEILKLIALLSISLGAINVLPIPALDGGRFMMILFELISRRRPNAIWEARIHAFGFVLILLLILAVTYNDILRLIAS